MSKRFNELKVDDNVYMMEISGNRVRYTDGKPIVSLKVRNVKNNCKYMHGGGAMEITVGRGNLFFPLPHMSSHLYKNSVDTSMYRNLNAYVYGTTKRDCIEAAIDGMKQSNAQQLETLEKLREKVKENNNVLKFLDEMLETADYPETALEFAEMALE
jgi:hypothetical protein